MFKSLWTKFGAKVLIIACSVLLLGGVAIASPKLKAATTVDPADIVSPAALTYNEQSQYPTSVQWNNPDTHIQDSLSIGRGGNTDLLLITDIQEGEYKNAGDYTVRLKVNDSSSKGLAGGEFDLSYTIKRKEISRINSNIQTENHFQLSDKIETTQSELESAIQVTLDNDSQPLSADEYSIAIKTPVRPGPNNQYTITLKNYTQNQVTSNSPATGDFNFTLVKNIDSFKKDTSSIILLDADGTNYYQKNGMPRIVITDSARDGDTDVNLGSITLTNADGQPTINNVVVDTGDNSINGHYGLNVTISDVNDTYTVDLMPEEAKNNYYCGTAFTLDYTREYGKLENATIPATLGWKDVFDYDEDGDGSYVQALSSLKLGSDTLWEGTDYEVSYQMLDREGNQNDDLTAGTVVVRVTGKNNYKKHGRLFYYAVKRNILKAIKKNAVNVSEHSYTYDGSPHQPEVTLDLNTSSDNAYQLTKDVDFVVYYSNARRVGGVVSAGGLTSKNKNSINAATTDAGKVTMKLVGNPASDGGGYYGEIAGKDLSNMETLEYTINPKVFSEDKYWLDLNGDKTTEPIKDYTGKPIDFTSTARIRTNDEDETEVFALADLSTDYYDLDAPDINPDDETTPDHTATLTFKGNYDGTLTAKYHILSMSLENCTIEITSPEPFVYNGKEQKPEFKVLRAGSSTPVDPAAYKTEYVNNINASTSDNSASIVVSRIGDSSDKKVATFTIEKRQLPQWNDVLQLSSDSEVQPYAGKNRKQYNAPGLLSFTDTDGNEYKELTEGVDFEVEQIARNRSVQEPTTNDPVYPEYSDDSDLSIAYVYKVNGINNFYGTSYTSPFKYEKRSLDEVTVDTSSIDPLKAWKNGLTDKYLDTNLKLIDEEFGTLVNDTDYTRDVVISSDGVDVTVTFTGKGAYKGEKTIQFKIGVDIGIAVAKAGSDSERLYVYEGEKKNENIVTTDWDGKLNLDTTSTYELNNKRGLKIGYGTEDGINLWYQDQKLEYGKHYVVEKAEDPWEETTNNVTTVWSSIKVVGNGQGYFGEFKIYFKVKRYNLTGNVHIVLTEDPDDTYVDTYTGKEIKPEILAFYTGSTYTSDSALELTEGVDYEIKYTNNVNAKDADEGTINGAPTITCTGKGLYYGTCTTTFTIKKRKIEYPIVWVEFLEGDGTTYKYQPKSVFDTYELPGVCPKVKVWFNPDSGKAKDKTGATELTEGQDYDLEYLNANTLSTDSSPASVKITAHPNSNFEDGMHEDYKIVGIDLTTDVTITVPDQTFNGYEAEPKVTVQLNTSNGLTPKEAVLTEGVDYAVGYSGNDNLGKATATITALSGGHCQTDYGPVSEDFYIRGDLSYLNNSGSEQCIQISGTGKRQYDETDTTIPLDLKVEIRFKDDNGDWLDWKTVGDLTEGTDYELSGDNTPLIVGVHAPQITGMGDKLKGKYWNTDEDVYYRIIGDLSADYTEPSAELTFDYMPGDETQLKKELEEITITCGGKKLVNGTDFEFESEPDTGVGTHTVLAVPTKQASTVQNTTKGYLLGDRKATITYTVKNRLVDSTIRVTGIEESYPYNFGKPVITENTNINVYYNGGTQPLRRDVDYTVTVEGCTDVAQGGTVVISGTDDSNYTGSVSFSIEITPYPLESAGSITVNGSANRVITEQYTGSKIIPNPIVEIGSYTLDPATDYYVMSKTNNVNVGSDYEYTIVGQGNFTGEVSGQLIIEPCNIEDAVLDESIDIRGITDQVYRPGKDLRYQCIPEVYIGSKKLSGQEYVSGQSTAGDTNIDFIYSYPSTDYTNVGTDKQVIIQGNGNFTGRCVKTFAITQKSIADSDVELKITGDQLIYNGQGQVPDFELLYDDTTILKYSNGKFITSYITDPQFEESELPVNATKTASVKLIVGEKEKNFKDSRTIEFSIDQLSLADAIAQYCRAAGNVVDLKNYELKLAYTGSEVVPTYATGTIQEGEVGIYSPKISATKPLIKDTDYDVTYHYVDAASSTDEEVSNSEVAQATEMKYAGKVKVTVTGKTNFTDKMSFYYYIGTDITDVGTTTCTLKKYTTVYNTKSQKPQVTVTGVTEGQYVVAMYKGSVSAGNYISDATDFVDAGTYYVRVEGNPKSGTFAKSPTTLTYTITPRPLSSSIVIDGFKKEYNYTGSPIQPVGIAVTDYIDDVKYKLSETKDYTLSYSNNTNVGSATINVNGINNFQGTATARFTITSSKITSGNMDANANIGEGIGSISSGNTTILPSDVRLVLNAANAMYYTGQELKPTVTISGLAQNVGYTVTYSNNIEVGTGVITITGIGNNSGTITKYFRIIADLDKCTVGAIPEQMYTGSAVTPTLTVTCGNSVLKQGTDYTVVYTNNINVGTATATLRAASNANYVGSKTVNFVISTNPTTTTSTDDKNATGGGFYVTGYSSSYTYTGSPIRPTLVVQSGNTVLKERTDYTVTYSNNVNVGTANITVTGIGKYSGTQNLTFEIVKKDIQATVTSGVSDKVYTGDVYTPSLTVTDGNKTLTNGVDYTVTYSNNTEPGIANITIQGMNSYTGTKTVSFKISGVAVSGLKANTVKSNSINLVWNAQEYADGYQICNKKSKVVKTVSKNSASMTGLSSGKTYKYKVRSYVNNADGTKSFGGFSSVVSATTKLSTPSVKIVSSTTGQAKISWSKVSGATGYEIYYKKSANGSYKKLKTINSTTVRNCIVKGMKSGDRYYFRVRAFKKTGSSKIVSAFNPLKVITIK